MISVAHFVLFELYTKIFDGKLDKTFTFDNSYI